MKEQWPSERQTEKRAVFVDSSFKSAQDFLHLLDAFPHIQATIFDELVRWIQEQDGSLAELEERTTPFANEFTPAIRDSLPLLMTLACAAALARRPSLQTWSKINAFTYNSSQIEHWLSEAMMAYAEVNSFAGPAYVELAAKVFTALDSFTLESKSTRNNKERSNAWVDWNERTDKLQELWWGLRGQHGFMNYEAELPLFQVFYKLEPDEFIRTVAKSTNPHLVSALLFVAGIGPFSPRHSEWRRMVIAAPNAFEDDGKWRGSVLMPLLLVEARNQLLEARLNLRNLAPSPSELDGVKHEITTTAEMVAAVLAERQDAIGIFVRWTPWLMRQILGQSSIEISDVTSSAFADDALIEAIGNKLRSRLLPQTSPDDAQQWEAWCYRCAIASIAHSGSTQVLDCKSFVNEWDLSPEDWGGTKGYILRERASLIITFNKETPGVAANLLAYPIAQSSSPVEIWIGLWNAAVTLREIVEFGDADATEDEYSSRSEAGRLLLLLFRIGLAIFDQGAARTSDNKSPGARTLVKLFDALNSATYEMCEIDSTLNRDAWLSSIQHLAVRRMIWEISPDNDSASGDFQVFKANDTPTVSEFLAKAKGDVTELITILQSLLLNSQDASRLKSYLHSASIDFSNIVDLIRNLNQYHPRKYPIDEAQLQKLETHLWTA